MVINLAVALIAYKLKALNIKAIILAYLLGVLILYTCFEAYILLLIYFSAVLTVEKILLKSKKEKRNSRQVLANIIFAFGALLLYLLTDENKFFLIYCCMLSVSLCDTLSSTIGTKFAKKVYSITKLKPITKGTSGGISLIGTIGGFTGNLIFAILCSVIAYILQRKASIVTFSAVCLSGFCGMIIDSFLGDVFQKKYRCTTCNKITDTKTCCGRECPSVGISLLTNTQVNLMSEGIICVLLLLIL